MIGGCLARTENTIKAALAGEAVLKTKDWTQIRTRIKYEQDL